MVEIVKGCVAVEVVVKLCGRDALTVVDEAEVEEVVICGDVVENRVGGVCHP